MLLIFVSLIFVNTTWAWSDKVCVLEKDREEYDIRPFMGYFEDKGKSLTIEDVSAAAISSRFGPPPKGHFNFGFTSAALWFRFTIAEKASESDAGSRRRVASSSVLKLSRARGMSPFSRRARMVSQSIKPSQNLAPSILSPGSDCRPAPSVRR